MRERSISGLGIGAWLLLVLLVGCGQSGKSEQGTVPKQVERISNVITTTVTPKPFANYIKVVGVVEAARRVTVSIEEAGVIKEIHVKKGALVKAGTLLAKLQDDLQQANFKEQVASLRLSELTLKNQKELFEGKASAEAAYLEAQYRHDIAQARYQRAQTHLRKTEIRSPITGIVDSKLMEIGELATPGRSFMDIVDIRTVKVVSGVAERYLALIHTGTAAEVTFDAYPGRTETGQITYVGTTVNRVNRTIPVEIELNNRDGLLHPEMVANIRMVMNEIPNALVIPQDAVVDTDQGKIVFLAEGDTARARSVKLGPVSQDQVVVEQGLQAGAQLIVIGHRDLVDGEPIHVSDRLQK